MDAKESGPIDPDNENNLVQFPGATHETPVERRYDPEHPSVRALNNELVAPIVEMGIQDLSKRTGADEEDLRQAAYESYLETEKNLGRVARKFRQAAELGGIFREAAEHLKNEFDKKHPIDPPLDPEESARRDEEQLYLNDAMDKLESMDRDILNTINNMDISRANTIKRLASKYGVSPAEIQQRFSNALRFVASHLKESGTDNMYYLPPPADDYENPES